MPLIALTDKKEVQKAFASFEQALQKSGQPIVSNLGWQGGNEDVTVYWHPRHQIWTATVKQSDRWWCSFGSDDPTVPASRRIIVEFNLPFEGVNRRCAGALARDERGRIIATHSGKLGGGRPGIGKTAFLSQYQGGNYEPVVWPDGRETEMILIGDVDSRRLLAQLAQFTREVERFKAWATTGQPAPVPLPRPAFPTEFSGTREYELSGTVVSNVDHGLVIRALAKTLEKLGHKIGWDRARDLCVLRANEQIRILFEAKTNLGPGSLYRGVGQLLLNGHSSGSNPALVFVLPGRPKQPVRDALAKLGIRVVTYRWQGDVPHFTGLNAVL